MFPIFSNRNHLKKTMGTCSWPRPSTAKHLVAKEERLKPGTAAGSDGGTIAEFISLRVLAHS
jgi:hypothetical protein